MINVENLIIHTIKKSISPNIYVKVPYGRYETEFPLVTVQQKDSTTSKEFNDSSNEEKFASVWIEINVFSNNKTMPKTEATKIMDDVDEVLRKNFNMNRALCEPTPNIEDGTIYRITARYRAVVDRNNIFYRS